MKSTEQGSAAAIGSTKCAASELTAMEKNMCSMPNLNEPGSVFGRVFKNSMSSLMPPKISPARIITTAAAKRGDSTARASSFLNVRKNLITYRSFISIHA